MKRSERPERKQQRRDEAAERQKAYDALPDEEKQRRNPNKVIVRTPTDIERDAANQDLSKAETRRKKHLRDKKEKS